MATEALCKRFCPLILIRQEDSIDPIFKRIYGKNETFFAFLKIWETFIHEEQIEEEHGQADLCIRLRTRTPSEILEFDKFKVISSLEAAWKAADSSCASLENVSSSMRFMLCNGLTMARTTTTVDHPVACIHVVPENHHDPVQWCLSSQAALKDEVEPITSQVCSPDILHFFTVVKFTKDPISQRAMYPADTMTSMSHVFGTNVFPISIVGNAGSDSITLEALFHTFISQALLPFMRNYITSSIDRQQDNHTPFSFNFAGRILAASRKLLSHSATINSPQAYSEKRSIVDPRFLLFRAMDFAFLIGDWSSFQNLSQKVSTIPVPWHSSIHRMMLEAYGSVSRQRGKPLDPQPILDAIVAFELDWELLLDLACFIVTLQEIHQIGASISCPILENLQKKAVDISIPTLRLLVDLLCFDTHSLACLKRKRLYDLYLILITAERADLKKIVRLTLSELHSTMTLPKCLKFKHSRAFISCRIAEEGLHEGPLVMDHEWWIQVPPSLQLHVLQSLPLTDYPYSATFLRVDLSSTEELNSAPSYSLRRQFEEIQASMTNLKVLCKVGSLVHSTSVQTLRRGLILKSTLAIPINIELLRLKMAFLPSSAKTTVELSNPVMILDSFSEAQIQFPSARPIIVDSRSVITLECHVNGKLFSAVVNDTISVERDSSNWPNSKLHLAFEMTKGPVFFNREIIDGTLKLENQSPELIEDLVVEDTLGPLNIPPNSVISIPISFFLISSFALRNERFINLMIPTLPECVNVFRASFSADLIRLDNQSSFNIHCVSVSLQDPTLFSESHICTTPSIKAKMCLLFLANDSDMVETNDRRHTLSVSCTIHGARHKFMFCGTGQPSSCPTRQS